MEINFLSNLNQPKLCVAGAEGGSVSSPISKLGSLFKGYYGNPGGFGPHHMGGADHCPTCGGEICPTCGGHIDDGFDRFDDFGGPGGGFGGPGGGGFGGPGGGFGGPGGGFGGPGGGFGGPGGGFAGPGGGGGGFGGGGFGRRRLSRGGMIAIVVAIVAVIAAIAITIGVVVSKNKSDDDDSSTEVVQATIYYYDLNGDSCKVSEPVGQKFDLPVLTKVGYKFLGYYDQASGGSQIVNENGISVDALATSKELVLYPHFSVNTYTIKFEADGAEGLVSTERKVSYDEELSPFEFNLTKLGYDFDGWFTMTGGKGVQITNGNGEFLRTNGNVFTFDNFTNFDGSTLTLYAGYSVSKIDVTLKYRDGTTDTIKVSYNNTINSVYNITDPYTTTDTACIKHTGWASSQNSKVPYTEKITTNITLYEIYVPVVCIDGTSIKDEISVGTYTLPGADALTVRVPTGKELVGWRCGDTVYNLNATVTIGATGAHFTPEYESIG